jgi:uncharacterized protein (DUF1778 family)
MPLIERVKDTLPKTERLEVRVTSQVKELIQHAADLQGRSLTDFILDNLQVAAGKVIHEHKVMELSLADSKIFVESLLNLPKPSARLKKAARRYKRLSGNK